MTWSLNEIEALARKAARGAGYSWGQAEEAGRAVRWLEARSLPGAAALADHLAWMDGMELTKLRPADGTTATGTPLCPLLTGMMLEDGLLDAPLRLGSLRAPLLLLPFLGWSVQARGAALRTEMGGAVMTVTGAGALHMTAPPLLSEEETLHLDLAEQQAGPPVAEGLRSGCSVDVAEALNAFATRTYAPATEESRLAGAGAGLTDND